MTPASAARTPEPGAVTRVAVPETSSAAQRSVSVRTASASLGPIAAVLLVMGLFYLVAAVSSTGCRRSRLMGLAGYQDCAGARAAKAAVTPRSGQVTSVGRLVRPVPACSMTVLAVLPHASGCRKAHLRPPFNGAPHYRLLL